MINILTGDNHFELKQAYRKILTDFTERYGQLAVEKFDGDEVAATNIIDAAQSVPMFSAKKLVFVMGGGKELLELIINIKLPEEVTMVIVSPKIDKRSALYSKIKKLAGFFDYHSQNISNISKWIIDIVHKHEGIISLSDANYLMQRIGSDKTVLSVEIEKLLTYNKEITKKSIDLLTCSTPQTTVFELLSAAFRGDQQRAYAIYQEQRTLNVDPLNIIGLITWQLHILAILKTAGKKSINEIAQMTKIKPYSLTSSQAIARNLNLEQIKCFVSDLSDIDQAIKTSKVDADQAIKLYLLNLTAR